MKFGVNTPVDKLGSPLNQSLVFGLANPVGDNSISVMLSKGGKIRPKKGKLTARRNIWKYFQKRIIELLLFAQTKIQWG